ncbi:MAG: nucleotidyltransferase domain-containing protein [Nanoarchaeota archaeon]
MVLTQKEKEALLLLFKDFTSYYNANYISKTLGISRVGAMKMLKKLLKKNILIDKQIGKATIYKLRLNDDYIKKLIAFLLADEANKFKKWKEEFKELFKKDRIILLYGSVIKNYSKANDIDIMMVIKKSEYGEISKIIKEKQKILPKRIHSIELTVNDFLNNIKQKKKAIIDIIKNAIILYGEYKYVEIIKNVTSL